MPEGAVSGWQLGRKVQPGSLATLRPTAAALHRCVAGQPQLAQLGLPEAAGVVPVLTTRCEWEGGGPAALRRRMGSHARTRRLAGDAAARLCVLLAPVTHCAAPILDVL